MLIVAVLVLMALGLKVTTKLVLLPGAMLSVAGLVVIVKSAAWVPVIVGLLMIRFVVPVF